MAQAKPSASRPPAPHMQRLDEMNEKELDGRKIFVNEARPREPRPAYSGGYGNGNGNGGGKNRNSSRRREHSERW